MAGILICLHVLFYVDFIIFLNIDLCYFPSCIWHVYVALFANAITEGVRISCSGIICTYKLRYCDWDYDKQLLLEAFLVNLLCIRILCWFCGTCSSLKIMQNIMVFNYTSLFHVLHFMISLVFWFLNCFVVLIWTNCFYIGTIIGSISLVNLYHSC